jgi:hypothetical protein
VKVKKQHDELQAEAGSEDSLTVPFSNSTVEASCGSGVEIFIESGDCDREFGADSGACERLFRAFLIINDPSASEDRKGCPPPLASALSIRVHNH